MLDRRSLALCVLITLSTLTARAAEPTVTDWGRAFAAPAIAGSGADAAGRVLTYGHLDLRFTEGRLYPVVVADRVVGAWFRGRGMFRYASTDPLEAATFHTNVKRMSSYTPGRGGVIGEPFETLLIVVSAGADAITGGAAGREGQVPEDVVRSFAKHLERYAQDRGTRYGQIMPQALVDPPDQPLVAVEIDGADNDVQYLFDTLRTRSEFFSVLRKLKTDILALRGQRLSDLLSEQPIGRERLATRIPRVMMTALDLTLVNPEGLKAELDATETFEVISPIRAIPLNLWSNRVLSVGARSVVEVHDYAVKDARLATGEALPFSHVNDDLVVQLPRAYARGERVTIRFKIAGDVLFNPGNDNYWDLPTSAWYPQLPLENEYATYHAVVKVRKPFTPFSCGRTLRRWEEGEMTCAEFREDKPIQIPVILAGKYITTSEERDGLTVRVSTYARPDKQAVERLTEFAFGVIGFFKPYLGDYPFTELNIIEVNDFGWGQAPSGIVFLTREAFSRLDAVDRGYSMGVNARIIHELTHAWWGDVAKLTSTDAWLAESTAQYYAAFAMGKLKNKDEFGRAMDEWRSRAAFVKDKGTVYMADNLSGPDGSDDRQGLLYGKGPMMLHALRKELGDDLFFMVMKSFLKNYNFKYAETRNFIALTNFAAKKDYGPFFGRYLFGTEWPDVK